MSSGSSSDVEFLYSEHPKENTSNFSNQLTGSDNFSPDFNKVLEEMKNSKDQYAYKLYEKIIEKFNKSLDFNIYHEALEILKKHGIGGCRLVASEFMVEICETVVSILYIYLPKQYQTWITSYIQQYIPSFSKQILKTPFNDFLQKSFCSKLFKGQEVNTMFAIFNWDQLYRCAVYVSHEKLPDNFQFTPSMSAPCGWTPIEDFLAITSAPFLTNITDITDDQALPFKLMIKLYPDFKTWILNRIEFVIREMSSIVPNNYNVYEDKGGKSEPKKLENIEAFKSLNFHVLHPKSLSVSIQKKLLRIMYLYGVPRENGIEKIRMILQCKSISIDLIYSFVVKVLQKATKYKPSLSVLTELISKNCNDVYVNIQWIKEEAIEAVAYNVDLLYQVRENYSYFSGEKVGKSGKKFDINKIPEWTEIITKCKWWRVGCDKILFKITAFYGFLFNSYFAFYIPSKQITQNEISLWKEKESFELRPIIHPKSDYLQPILSHEMRKKRIIQILKIIEYEKNI